MNDSENPKLEAVRQLPLHRHLGVTDLTASDGRSELWLTVDEASTNPAGVLHGGVLYMLCDVASYTALLSVLDHAREAATHDIHVSVMAPATPGERVRFCGRVVQQGKRLVFTEAEARAGDRLLATARVTKTVFTPRGG